MSDRLVTAADMIGEAYVKTISSGAPSAWHYQVARALDEAGRLREPLPKPDREGIWWPSGAVGSIRRDGDQVRMTVFDGEQSRTIRLPREHAAEVGRMMQAAAGERAQ